MPDGDAEREGPAIAGELLNRARDEGVALLDVDGFGQLVLAKVAATAREPGEIGGRRDAKTAERREVTILDHLRQRARRHDALEDLVEAFAVAARGGRGEADQRAAPAFVERAERAKDAEVVGGGGVVALVVDHQAEVATGQHPREARLVERADRGDQDLRFGRRALGAALDRRDAGAAEGPLDLVACLGQELLAVGEHEHLAAGEARELGEHHRLAGAGREADDHPPNPGAPRGEHGVDRFALIGSKEGRGRHVVRLSTRAKDSCSELRSASSTGNLRTVVMWWSAPKASGGSRRK